MKRWLLAFLITIYGALQVSADQVGFSPYRIVSSDGKYVFVMLTDYGGKEYGHYDYPSNGLYLNDGSKTPLWTVDWVAYAHLPADGVHVVKQAWLPDGYDGEAITFFAYGKPIKTYSIRDLIDLPSLLPHSISSYRWNSGFTRYEGEPNTPIMFVDQGNGYTSKSVTFDERAHTMSLRTFQGNVFVFDVNTGEILEAHRPVRTTLLISLVIGLIAYSLYVARTSKRPRIAWWQSTVRMVLYSALLSSVLLASALLLMSFIRTAESAPNGLLYESVWRFLWYWPARYRYGNTFSYQFPEIQTFVAWMCTFLALGLANESVVRAVKRLRERGLSSWA